MSNRYSELLKAAGLLSGVKRGWQDATPSQRLTIGIGGSGGVMSIANLANNATNTLQARRKNDLDEKSLRALQSINRKLSETALVVGGAK